MLSKGKLISLALAVTLTPQLARCQAAGDGTTNANKAAAAPAVAVSVGPIVATNTCLIATAPDANALKCELAAEVNRAKTELAEQNRERMDALGEKCDAKCKDVIADVRRDFFELKDILDEARTSNANALAWFGVLSTIVGVLATIFGIVIPIVMEHKREKGYETLEGKLEQRKAEYDTLKETLENQQKDQEQKEAARQKEYEDLKKSLEDQQKAQEAAEKKRQKDYEELRNDMKRMRNSAYGVTVSYQVDTQWEEYKKTKKILNAKKSVSQTMTAIHCFVHGDDDAAFLKTMIVALVTKTEILKTNKQLDDVQKKLENKSWCVTPTEVRAVLAKEKDVDDLCKRFEEIYATYGKPKEESKQPNGEK